MDKFLEILTDWNERMNLVGPLTLGDVFWERHGIDSAQLLVHAPKALQWADIGAGAGFPGLVLAILLHGKPGACVHLIESLTKRCVFLRHVSEALDLPTVVHNLRAEQVKGLTVDIVTARAVSALPKLLEFARPLLRGTAVGLFLKGRECEAEVTEAHKVWRFDCKLIGSASSADGKLCRVERLEHI
jgi:16S rRNA (guanine527-N7)-methyltransferase